MKKIFASAVEKRTHFLKEETSLYRVFDGRGDGQEGIYVDVFEGKFLISTIGNLRKSKWKKVKKRL